MKKRIKAIKQIAADVRTVVDFVIHPGEYYRYGR